jgi:hypothetical protein
LPYRETLSDYFLGDFALEVLWDTEEASRVSLRKASIGYEVLEIWRKLQKPEEIRNGASVLTCPLADLLVAEV